MKIKPSHYDLIWLSFFFKKKRKLFNDDPLYCVFGHPFIYIVTFVSHTCMNNKNTITIINLKTRIQIHWFCWWWYSKEKEREKKNIHKFVDELIIILIIYNLVLMMIWWWFSFMCFKCVCVCVFQNNIFLSLFFSLKSKIIMMLNIHTYTFIVWITTYRHWKKIFLPHI